MFSNHKKFFSIPQNIFRRNILTLLKNGLNFGLSKHHQNMKKKAIDANLELKLTRKEINENRKFRRRIDLIVERDMGPSVHNNVKEIMENSQTAFSTEINANHQFDTVKGNSLLQESDQFQQRNQLSIQQQTQEQKVHQSTQLQPGNPIIQMVPSNVLIITPSTLQSLAPIIPPPDTDIDRQFRIGPTSAPNLQGQSASSPQFNAERQQQRAIATTFSPFVTSPSLVDTTSSNVNQNTQAPNQQQTRNPQQTSQAIQPQNRPQTTSTVNPNAPTFIGSSARPVATFLQPQSFNNSTAAPIRNIPTFAPPTARTTQFFAQTSKNVLVDSNTPIGNQIFQPTSTPGPVRAQVTPAGQALPLLQQQSLTNASASLPQGNQVFGSTRTSIPAIIFTTTTPRAQTNAPTCKQTCDQVVTGRNLRYQRALNIIQNEEYLSATDSSILRRKDPGLNDYEDILENPSTYFNDFQRNDDEVLSREKRATIDPVILNYLQAGTVNGYCNDYYSKGSVLFFSDLSVVIQNVCNSLCCGAYFPTIAEVACCNCDYNCIAASSTIYIATKAECRTYLTSFGSAFFPAYCENPSSLCPTTASSCSNCMQQAMQVGAAVVGVGAVVAGGAIIAMPPIQPLVTAQGVPQGSPQPGTPFGGAPPVPTSAASVAALALVPLGLIPVAVFPPFERPRTKPAIAVIFAENPNIMSFSRLKRSLQSRMKRSQKRPSTWYRAMNVLKTFIKTKTYPVQKKWKRFNDEIQCLKTRVLVYAKKVRNLYRKGFNKQRLNAYKEGYQNYNNYSAYHNQKNYNYLYNADEYYSENNSNNTRNFRKEAQYNYNHPRRKREMRYDECFPGVQEPLYGFKVKVTLAQNSPCTLGGTCRGNPLPSLDFNTVANVISGRKSEDFDDLNNVENFSDLDDLNDDLYDLNDLDRQTGEEFTSEAPTDCRVTCT